MYGLKPLSKVPECDIELAVVRGKQVWNLYNMGLSYEMCNDTLHPHNNFHSLYDVYHKCDKLTTLATTKSCEICSKKIDVLRYAVIGQLHDLCISCANWLIYDVNTFIRYSYKFIYQTFHVLYATQMIDNKRHYFTLKLQNYIGGMLELSERAHKYDCFICNHSTQFGYVDANDRALCKLCARFPLEIISRIAFKCILLIGAMPNDLIIAIYEYIIAIYDAIFRTKMFVKNVGSHNYI